nr:helix-turn-helix domain-containing protein [Amycolatopsis sp. CA-128772]
MEIECDHGEGDSCAVAVAIRELAVAVRATLTEPLPDPDALLTAEEVGELLQLSPRTLKDQAAVGVLPHHRFGKHYRFTRADVAEIVEKKRSQGWPTARKSPARVSGVPGTSVPTGRGGVGPVSPPRRLPRSGAGAGGPDPAKPLAGPAGWGDPVR